MDEKQKYDFSGLDEFDESDDFDKKEYDFSDIDVLDKYKEDEIEELPEPTSMLETVGRLGLSGASSGLTEELGAGIRTIPSWITEQIRESSDTSKLDKIQEELITNLTKNYHKALQSGDQEKADKIQLMIEKETALPFKADEAMGVGEIYRGYREGGREATKVAAKAHPKLAVASEIVGGILPAVFTGGASAVGAVAKTGAKLAAKELAKSGGKWGAVEAFGRSEADLTKGEIGEMAKDVAIGTTTGAVTGVALPMAGKALIGTKAGQKVKETFMKGSDLGGKTIKSIRKGWNDFWGDIGIEATVAGKTTRGGTSVVDIHGRNVSQRVLQNDVKKLSHEIHNISKPEAIKEITEAVGIDKKLEITDDVNSFIKDLDDKLSQLDLTSDEAKGISNIKAQLMYFKTKALKDAGQDVELPTTSATYAKLLKEQQSINKQLDLRLADEDMVDSLVTKALRVKNGKKIDANEIKIIQETFDIETKNGVIELLKDVGTIKGIKTQFNKKTGTFDEYPFELKTVLDRHRPEIIKDGDWLGLKQGTKYTKPILTRPEIDAKIEISAQELLNFRKSMRDLTYNESGFVKSIGADIDSKITKSLKDMVGPEGRKKFEHGMQIYQDIYNIEEILPEISKMQQTAGKDKMIDAAVELFQKGLSGMDSDAAQKLAIRGLKSRIIRSVPSLGKKFVEKLQKDAQLLSIRDMAQKTGVYSAMGTVQSMGIKGAAGIGRGMQAYDYTKHAMKTLMGLPSKGLSKLANKTNNPRLKTFLNELALVENANKKNALLFSAMQNPELRIHVQDMFDEDEKLDKEEK